MSPAKETKAEKPAHCLLAVTFSFPIVLSQGVCNTYKPPRSRGTQWWVLQTRKTKIKSRRMILGGIWCLKLSRNSIPMQWGNNNPVSTTRYRKASLSTEDFTGPILHVKVKVLVTQWCSSLCNPMDHCPPGSSVPGIS